METISKHLEQMCIEDANSTTKPTTSINAVANKVTHEQQWPRKRPQENWCRNCDGKYHMNGDRHPALHSRTSVLIARDGTFHLCLFQKTKRRGQTTENKPPPHPQARTSRRPVNCIEGHQQDSNSGSDTEYVFHTGKVKKLPYFDLSFGDGHQMFNVLADTGATINILSEADYKSLRPTPSSDLQKL